jgi:DNA processing protein
MTKTLPQDERIARLRLIRTDTIGPITFHKLLRQFGNAQAVLEALPLMAAKAGRQKSLRVMTVQQAENELKALHDFGGEMIVWGDDRYPEWLSHIEDAPPVLNYIGNIALAHQSCFAIVGARNASANARRFTQKIAVALGAQNQVIVSGLARGIDTAAHEASLDSGTIAVLAGGLDQVYPLENTGLYNLIKDKGCILSEMPLGTKPTAHHFPRRNRIVSGLSKGVLVAEATLKSGSLITARLAAEQGREVFAVPGFPGDPRGAGPNNLIQNGAKLVTSADDILSELISVSQPQSTGDQLSFDGVAEPEAFFEGNDGEEITQNIHDQVIDTLSHTPFDIDEIVRSSGLSVQNIQMTLLELEVTGQVQRHPGNRVSRVA